MENELEQLDERIAEQAAHLDAATHRLLADLRAFDTRGGWHVQGHRSCSGSPREAARSRCGSMQSSGLIVNYVARLRASRRTELPGHSHWPGSAGRALHRAGPGLVDQRRQTKLARLRAHVEIEISAQDDAPS